MIAAGTHGYVMHTPMAGGGVGRPTHIRGMEGWSGELIRVTQAERGSNTSVSALARAISSTSSPIYDAGW